MLYIITMFYAIKWFINCLDFYRNLIYLSYNGEIMEEFIDLYDDNKKNTGIVIPRSKEKELLEGYHILVSALLELIVITK